MANFEICEFLLKFYIFKGERSQDDCIRLCNPRTYIIMPKKAWMTTFMFKEFLSFFTKIIRSENFQTCWHVLILNGHELFILF